MVAAAIFAAFWSRRTAPSAVIDPPRLTYVATAEQLGVVGYRDPVGAIAGDGMLVAFSEGRRLYETPATGGARRELAAADGQIRHLAAMATPGEWLFEDAAATPRWWSVSAASPKQPLFGSRSEIPTAEGSPTASLGVDVLRQIVASADDKWFAAIAARSSGVELWRILTDGSRAELLHGPAVISSPAWTASGDVACVLTVERRARLSVPCGQAALALDPDVDVIGPLAFSPTTPAVYFASPNQAGSVDLWRADLETRHAQRVSSFSRDSYAPSVTADGRVFFKVQTYRTSVAELDLTTSAVQQLSTLQAETPSYHPDGRHIAVTFGTWRRVVDDAKYPDIAQEIGVIRAMPIQAPAAQPLEIIANSDSEDQAMAWSPNGKWIVLHSHREQSDDIWLRSVGGGAPDRRVSFLGRGAEVGWPRWSPDGKWVLYDGASPATGQSVLFVIGIDQETGAITAPPREVSLTGFDGEITHGEWLPDNATIAAIAKDAPGQHAIVLAPAAGGEARVVHRFSSEHDFPGLGISPDGTRIAFVGPAPDGFYQIFALAATGGVIQQLTTDRAHKTQPAWSPDGRRLAFTVWSYDVQFWLTRP